jgi:hypothetical protein
LGELLPPSIDAALVKARVKAKLGPLAFSTVSYRLAVLGKWHRINGWDNPAEAPALKPLLREARADWASGTGALYRAFDDRPVTASKMLDDLPQAASGDETEIQRARYRQVSFWLKFFPSHMHIYFLIAETESQPAFSECFQAHPHHAHIKIHPGFCIYGGEYKVIQMSYQWVGSTSSLAAMSNGCSFIVNRMASPSARAHDHELQGHDLLA